MTFFRLALIAALLTTLAGAADARALKLKLAKPQPSGLTQGLKVQYAYPNDVQSLRDAYIAIGVGAEPGTPLSHLDYVSSKSTPNALTSKQEQKVAAQINGYIKFDAPGTYTLQFYSNDGLRLNVGGQEVAEVDEKRSCKPTGKVEVRVKKAGWYELDALYWQRKGTSCLQMQWAAEGDELKAVPAAAFGY